MRKLTLTFKFIIFFVSIQNTNFSQNPHNLLLVNNSIEGENIFYFRNGQISTKYYVKNGFVDGEVIEFYSNGKIREKSNFKNGRYNGKSISYTNKGQLYIENIFKNDTLLIYTQNTYFKNGCLKQQRSIVADTSHLTLFSFVNTKVTDRLFVYDVQLSINQIASIGLLKEYHKNGSLKYELQLLNNKFHGNYIEFYETGEKYSEGTYSNDKIDGEFNYFNKDGSIKKVEKWIAGVKQK